MIGEIFYIWGIGMLFSLWFQITSDEVRGYRIVFWPISLIKWLVESFIKALKD